MTSPLVTYLPQNKKGRDFVVGDLHGCFHLLDKALKKAYFNPECDRVICVGDLINRGPASLRCLEFIGQPWFHAVRGNHEQFYIDAYEKAGMRFDDNSLTPDNAWLMSVSDEIKKELYEKFITLPVIMQVTTSRGEMGIVHADIPKGMDWQTFKDKITARDKKTFNTAIFGRGRITRKTQKPIKGIDRVFLGHTPQKRGVKRLGNTFYIDTGAVYDGQLTLAEMVMEKNAYRGKPKKSRLNIVMRIFPDNALPDVPPEPAAGIIPAIKKIGVIGLIMAGFLIGKSAVDANNQKAAQQKTSETMTPPEKHAPASVKKNKTAAPFNTTAKPPSPPHAGKDAAKKRPHRHHDGKK